MTSAAESLNWQDPDYGPVWRERLERAQRLEAMPEAEFVALLAYYREHPADWISDWGVTTDPRMAELGKQSTLPFVLFPKQRDAVDWIISRWKGRENGVVEKSRDMGVSWVTVGVGCWMWSFHPDSMIGFGSRKEVYVDNIGDPKSLFWKVRSFIDHLPPRLKPKGYGPKCCPFMRVMNPANGAAIIGEAGDNIGRGARASIYFVDEAAHLEHPEEIDAALSQTTNCQIDVSTPNGTGNPFWRKRFGGRVSVFVFDWRDDPRKGQGWYDAQVKKHAGDPVMIGQEIDRDYSASVENSFIPGAIVSEAMARGPADVQASGPIRVGVDVARFGDDRTVMTIRRGRVVLKQLSWGKTDTMSTAAKVRQVLLPYRSAGAHVEQIAVDVIGVGSGVADRLREWYGAEVADVVVNHACEDGVNYDLRTFMWAEMKAWLERPCVLPNDQELAADLTGLRYGYRGGMVLLESKADAKKRGLKSPDRGDSLALTFAIPGGAKPQSVMNRGNTVVVMADDETGL